MHLPHNSHQEEFRPRLIVWQVTPDGVLNPNETVSGEPAQLTLQECYLVIESIAKVSKPIIVLTGPHILRRTDLFEIIEYGVALGFKIIVEIDAHDVSEEMIRKYSAFGPKIFRLKLNGAIVEDSETRFQQSEEFSELEKSVAWLKSAGFEIHFTADIKNMNIRELAFKHDYAVRKNAKGVYCHFVFGDVTEGEESGGKGDETDSFVESIAMMKHVGPKNMFFSPQCIKYTYKQETDFSEEDFRNSLYGNATPWNHSCLAGKSFASINANGVVQLCGGLPIPCGDLKANGYNFRKIWESSEVLAQIRSRQRSCSETQYEMKPFVELTIKKDNHGVKTKKR